MPTTGARRTLTLGLGTTDQVFPFHDSMRVRSSPVSVEYWPTAAQAVSLIHDTSRSGSEPKPGLGLGTNDQKVPFHDSTKVRGSGDGPPVNHEPTVTQLDALMHDTP